MQESGRNKAAKKGCACGVGGCIAFVIGIAGFVGLILYFTVFSNSCAKMMGEETYPIAGKARSFDPIAEIENIRSKIGAKAVLTEMDASSVRSDGTMDLMAQYKPAPTATYRFQLPLDTAPEGQVAPPVGAGRGPDDVWVQDITVRVYEPGMRRHVTRTSGGSRSSYSYTNEGIDVERSTPRMTKIGEGISEVKVDAKEMWEFALKLGAPKDAVASIDIEADEYTFGITGTKIHLRWDADGKLMDLFLTKEQRETLGLPEVGR